MLQPKINFMQQRCTLDFFIPLYVLNFLKFISHIVGQQKSHTLSRSEPDPKAGSDATVLPTLPN